MFFLTVGKEIVHNILSFRFVVTYALLFCLILMAMFLMTNDYQRRLQEFSAADGKVRENLAELVKIEDPAEQFQRIRQADFSALRLPTPLSLLALGLEGSLPTQVSSQSHFFVSSSDDRLGRNVLFDIFQTPDVVYVVNVVMSLLALLFVFDSVCGEKEQGTLKLLLSNSVPRDSVLLGKWVGGFFSVAAPFAVAVLGGFTYIYISGAMEMKGEDMARFGLIFVLSLLYISTFFTLGLMISTLTHRSSTALLVSLLVWICWILVVPNMAPIAARLAAPVPGRQVIEAEKQAIDREVQLLMAGIGKRKVYGDQKESESIRQDGESKKRKLEEFYQDKMSRQISYSKNLARLSPSASYLFAATRLAGTGPNLFDYFQKALDRFHQGHDEFRQSMYSRDIMEWTQSGPKVKDPDWFDAENLPRFDMFAESLDDSFDAALFDILLLAVFNVLFFMLSYTIFIRYDVT